MEDTTIGGRTKHLDGIHLHLHTVTEDISVRRDQNHDLKMTLSMAHKGDIILCHSTINP